MYNKTWKSLVLVGMLIFKIEQCMLQLQDAEMVSDILDHPVCLCLSNEPHHEQTCFLHMPKQRHRLAGQ